MNKHPLLYRLLGLFVLTVPTIIYLCFLIPILKEEYVVLMSSSGVLGGAGFVGSAKIPVDWKHSGLFKLSANVFTVLIIITLVEEFIMELIFLVVTFVVSFICYKLLEERYKTAKRRKENEQLANSIAQSVIKNS